MKKEITKEQVLDAVKSTETLSQAEKKLGIKHTELMQLFRKYGIAAGAKKKKAPDYEKLYKKAVAERDSAIEAFKQVKSDILSLGERLDRVTEGREYFARRYFKMKRANEWLLKYTPWLRRWYHKKWDMELAPWAAKLLMAINEKLMEEHV